MKRSSADSVKTRPLILLFEASCAEILTFALFYQTDLAAAQPFLLPFDGDFAALLHFASLHDADFVAILLLPLRYETKLAGHLAFHTAIWSQF